MFSMVIGAALYAVFIASLTSVVSDLNGSARAYLAKLDMVYHTIEANPHSRSFTKHLSN